MSTQIPCTSIHAVDKIAVDQSSVLKGYHHMLISCVCGNVIEISPEYPMCTICGAQYDPQEIRNLEPVEVPKRGVDTLDDMISYLEMIYKLECSVHNQERTKEAAEIAGRLKKPFKNYEVKPKTKLDYFLNKQADPAVKDLPPDYFVKNFTALYNATPALKNSKFKKIEAILLGLVALVCFVIIFVFGTSAFSMVSQLNVSYEDSGPTVLFTLVVLVIGMVAFARACSLVGREKTIKKERDQFYKHRDEQLQELKSLQDDYIDFIDKYEKIRIEDIRNFEEYNAKQQANEAKYNYELQVATYNHAMAQIEIDLLDEPLNNTRAILEQLYSLNVIYPKYRNMIAMSSIFEYFDSGRVTELTGPNGAYNLYEQEVRLDRIVDRLDKILKHLEDIKYNQFTLYSELKAGNKMVDAIRSEVKEINNGTVQLLDSNKQIASNTEIVAHYNKITAENSYALNYLKLLFG